jgi:hypothetical protein
MGKPALSMLRKRLRVKWKAQHHELDRFLRAADSERKCSGCSNSAGSDKQVQRVTAPAFRQQVVFRRRLIRTCTGSEPYDESYLCRRGVKLQSTRLHFATPCIPRKPGRSLSSRFTGTSIQSICVQVDWTCTRPRAAVLQLRSSQ